MPFPEQNAVPFTRRSVLNLIEGQFGCYALFHRDLCIFVGRGDIRARLLDHINGDNPRITSYRPTHFVAAVTPDAEALEKQLIAELAPECTAEESARAAKA